MDLQTRINELKNKAMGKIENAAKVGNTSLVVSNSRIVEEIDNLEKRLSQLVASLDMLEEVIKKNGENLDFSQIEHIGLREKISRKKIFAPILLLFHFFYNFLCWQVVLT